MSCKFTEKYSISPYFFEKKRHVYTILCTFAENLIFSMKRKLSNRQVTWFGVLIGLLISGGIFGLWSAVRHINEQEIRAQEEKDSVRTVYREHLAEEVAKEQALQDSIDTYQSTHSSTVIARRMQIILSDELKHANQRPYYDKYRTPDFKSDLQEVITFDKTPREEKPEMTFRDMPFYQLIPAKMIRDLVIKRIYYVTENRARVDVRYLVKRVEKFKEGDQERDTTFYERKTATYRLAYQDGEWMVDDRMVDFLSEREAFKRYMEGEYFIDPVEEEIADSLVTDSLLRPNALMANPDNKKVGSKKEESKKNDVKKKEEPKKSDAKKKDEPKKNDVKKKDEDKKKKDDANKKNESKKNDVKKTDSKKKEESKKSNDTKKNDSKNNDTKKSDAKKNEVKKSDTKKSDAKKNEVKKNDTKKNEVKKSDSKKSDVKKTDSKKKEEPKKKNDSKSNSTTKK